MDVNVMPSHEVSFRVGCERLHDDTNLDFQLNRLCSDGSPELVAEVHARAREIESFEDWVTMMLALAEHAESAGRLADTARYVRAAEFFMSPSDARKRPTYSRFIGLFDRLHGGTLKRVAVPFQGGVLPAYVLDRGGSTTTLVVHGGFDSFIEEFMAVFQRFADRGFRVVAFEGPGQGGALVKSGLHMTHEWEKPTSAVLDHFDVDDCVLVGISLGGYLALRAAAFEPRISQVVAYDILYDFFECVASRRGHLLVPVVRQLLDRRLDRALDRIFRLLMQHDRLARWGIEQGMHVTGASTPSAFLRETRSYTTEAISSGVRQDVLLLAGEDDHFVPLAQLERQRRALVNARSVTERIFRREEHAASHCQIGNFPLVLDVITDWIRSVRAR